MYSQFGFKQVINLAAFSTKTRKRVAEKFARPNLLFFLLMQFLLCQNAFADFGSADVGGKNNETRTFEAWCASKGNSCKVSFTTNSITINDTDSVVYRDIKYFHYNAINGNCQPMQIVFCEKSSYTFDIVYSRLDGSEGVGKIIFAKENVAVNFMLNLRNATGNKPWAGDPRCKQGEVFHEGLCLTTNTAAEVRVREKESMNAKEAMIEQGRAIGTGMAVQGQLQKEGLEGIQIQQNTSIQQNTGVLIVPR